MFIFQSENMKIVKYEIEYCQNYWMSNYEKWNYDLSNYESSNWLIMKYYKQFSVVMKFSVFEMSNHVIWNYIVSIYIYKFQKNHEVWSHASYDRKYVRSNR